MKQIYRRAPMPKRDSNKVKITFRYGCPPVNLLHIFRTPFPRNTSGGLLLNLLFAEMHLGSCQTFMMELSCQLILQKSFMIQKQPPEVLFRKKLFLKFRNIHRKTPVLESLFNKVACN